GQTGHERCGVPDHAVGRAVPCAVELCQGVDAHPEHPQYELSDGLYLAGPAGVAAQPVGAQSRGQKANAQFLAVCSAYILAETLSHTASLASQLRETRSVSQ